MDNLLKYLIRKLYTLDGTKGTANAVVNLHHKAAVDKYIKENKLKTIQESVSLKLKLQSEHLIFRTVFLKYSIIRIRSKISFIAF
jgi:hypothetical protein